MDGVALKASNVGPLAELLEQIVAGAVAPAREEGFRSGYAAGQRAEREAWRARMWAMLAEAGEQPAAPEQDTKAGVPGAAALVGPPPEAVGMTAVKAVEEEAEAGAGVPTGALSSPASVPQPMGQPPNTGGEDAAAPLAGSAADRAPASPELPAGDDDDGQPSGAGCVAPVQDPGPASVAAAGASPEAPGASPAASAPLWEDWRTPEREVVLRAMWPQAGASMKAIFQALAEIQGPKMPAEVENARHWGKRLNLGPRPVMSPQAASAPAAEAAAEPEDVRETPQMVRARELLAMGLHPNDIKSAVRLSAVEFAAIQRAHAEAA